MKIFLVDVQNAVEMAHYETFFYENIKKGKVSVFERSLSSLDDLGSVLNWLNEDINRNPFTISRALVIFFLPRRLASRRITQDFEIFAQMYISEMLEQHLDSRFSFLCFYLDDTGRERGDDRVYQEIDEVNNMFSSDNQELWSSLLPNSISTDNARVYVKKMVDQLPDKTASRFYLRVLDNLEKTELAEDEPFASGNDWYRNMFLRTCHEFVSGIKVFRGAFFAGDIEQKIRTVLKIVRYICSFVDNYDDSKDFDIQLSEFTDIKNFEKKTVDLDAERVLIATYKERLAGWKPPEFNSDQKKNEPFSWDATDHSKEFKEKVSLVSMDDLHSALDPKDNELSDYDLQEKVFASLDILIQDVNNVLREFCEERISEMRQFFLRSLPAVTDRADGIALLDEELEKERGSAEAMCQYIIAELPGYPAELKMRQELDLLGRKIRRIGSYMKAMKPVAFLLSLLFGIVSVGGYYYALQNSILDKEDTWSLFRIYLAVCGLLFAASYLLVRAYYRRRIRKYLNQCFELVMDHLQSYIDRASEFEMNLNAAMQHYCIVDENNKKTGARSKHIDFERRKQWHRLRIGKILNNLSFFDAFIKNTHPEEEKAVPEMKLLEDDALHSDFYQMRIF